MSERMTDERLAEICQIKLVEYKDTTALLVELKHALKAEREENQRLKTAIKEHKDSFEHDMDANDWTTEDENLWNMLRENQHE